MHLGKHENFIFKISEWLFWGAIEKRERIGNRKEENDQIVGGRLGEEDFRKLELRKQRWKRTWMLKADRWYLLEQMTPRYL